MKNTMSVIMEGLRASVDLLSPPRSHTRHILRHHDTADISEGLQLEETLP